MFDGKIWILIIEDDITSQMFRLFRIEGASQ